jgi:monoamine oxidase
MSDDEFRADVLGELDAVLDGAASRTSVRHLVQNWNAEPFAGAAYLADDASSAITRRLAEPLGERVFFAGDAYTSFDDWSSVHTAARSAADAVERIVG